MDKRKSVNYAGHKQQNPIPDGSRIGDIFMSSVLYGSDPDTRSMPPDLEDQIVNVFRRIQLCVEAAGGTVSDIIKANFWMKHPLTDREALNGEWLKMFPDENSRPARHTLTLGVESSHHLTCDFIAVIRG